MWRCDQGILFYKSLVFIQLIVVLFMPMAENKKVTIYEQQQNLVRCVFQKDHKDSVQIKYL